MGRSGQYQRILNKKRVKVDIPKYLSEKGWALPNTIICATEIGSRKRIRLNRGTIALAAKTGSLWVIDGQHRLYSFANVPDEIKSERLLTVVIDSARLGDKAESIQADMFFNLNSHAQRVKQSLVLDLLKDLLQTDSLLLRVAFNLCESKLLSPVIKTYSKDDGLIDIVTISSTQSMVQLTSRTGPILRGRRYDSDTAVNIVSSYIQDYFRIVKSIFKKEWGNPNYIICDNRGFRVLTRILYQIIVKNRRAGKQQVLRIARKALIKLKSNTTFEAAAYKGEGLGEGGANKLAQKWIGIFSGISVTDSIPRRETENTEFKSSLRWDVVNNARNDSLAGEITKAVCAFQNTSGGTVFIGIDDNAALIGIENDLQIFSKNRNAEDAFLRSIKDYLKKDLGAAAAAAAQVTIHERSNKKFVTITVDQSTKPIFVRRTKFYYRSGASCQAPEGEDQHEYIKDHFSP